jgi:predicted O-linked N-acetylglucosamine transferase (SPINDLY family)
MQIPVSIIRSTMKRRGVAAYSARSKELRDVVWHENDVKNGGSCAAAASPLPLLSGDEIRPSDHRVAAVDEARRFAEHVFAPSMSTRSKTGHQPPKLGIDALVEKGMALHRAGDLERAEQCYRDVLRRNPAHATAWYLRSVIAMGEKQFARAAELLEQAARHAPSSAVILCNLGEAYRRLERNEDAAMVLRRAVEAQPDLAEAHFNLGIVERAAGRVRDAIDCFERALSLKPDIARLGLEIVSSWAELEREDLAVQAYERMRGVITDSAPLRAALADIYARNLMLDEAIGHFEAALVLEPNDIDAHAGRAIALADRGEVTAAVALSKSLVELHPDSAMAHGNLLFLMMFDASVDALAIREQAGAFQQRHAAKLVRRERHANSAEPGRRLRIGYVSPDFRQHSVASFLLPILRHHDREQFEVFAYSNVQNPDSLTDVFRGTVDGFRDVSRLDDETVAAMIERDGIDVLVDLAMHSAHNRLLVFARKPAPVQICHLAYIGTTGLVAMDYRITEPRLDPPEQGDDVYSERSLFLPECWFCYDPLVERPVGSSPAAQNGHVTFGSTNAFRKVSDGALTLWGRVLRALPGSRMIIHAPGGMARSRALSLLADSGVSSDRIEFIGRMTREQYFAIYDRIDVCLDTIPYNGGTTTLDAFWMGVPTLTRLGDTAVGRAGHAIVHHLGLSELSSRTDEEYVANAVRVAQDVTALATLREQLRLRLEQSVLMDAPRFTRNLERLLRDAWGEWCHRGTTGAR